MDFAPNLTPRYIAEYKSAGLQHGVMLRGPASANINDFINDAKALFTSIQTALHAKLPTDFTWLSAKACPALGTNFSTAAAPAQGSAGLIDVADMSHMNRASELNFMGRNATTPWSLAIFGYFLSLDDPASPASNGRVEAGQDAAVTAVYGLLNANTGLATAANVRPILYSYANYKVNDHWLRIARKTQI